MHGGWCKLPEAVLHLEAPLSLPLFALKLPCLNCCARCLLCLLRALRRTSCPPSRWRWWRGRT